MGILLSYILEMRWLNHSLNPLSVTYSIGLVQGAGFEPANALSEQLLRLPRLTTPESLHGFSNGFIPHMLCIGYIYPFEIKKYPWALPRLGFFISGVEVWIWIYKTRDCVCKNTLIKNSIVTVRIVLFK